MANDEDVARLRLGVAAWNVWRARDPERIVDLREAILGATDLGAADLRRADLSGANLSRMNLSGAHLDGADFSGAKLYETVFADVDLSATKGLDACTHQGPSIIDHRTLRRSGRLPLAFLRGCGYRTG